MTAVIRSRPYVMAAGAALTGCERVPSIDLLGAFFPSWMLCIVIGIVLTLAVWRALAAGHMEPRLGPAALLYPALALTFTLVAWLAFFQG